MCEDLPGARGCGLGVDGDDDALVAELVGARRDHLGLGDGGGVEADFVGAGQQQGAGVLGRTDAAAYGERHEALLGGAAGDVEQRAAVLGRSGDVEKAELVRACGVVGARGLDRVAGVDEIDEVDALDDAAVRDVEAGDDADLEHQARSRIRATAVPAPIRAVPPARLTRRIARGVRTQPPARAPRSA